MRASGNNDGTMATPAHTRLLNAAAKAHLAPIGCQQKGRSRFWFADQGWWAIAIEFQPSAYSQGSYLNVGATWLWNPKPYWNFDEGHRVAEFREFEDEVQFTQAADELARQAVDEVTRLRATFKSVEDLARHLLQKQDTTCWDHFHAAISCGLSGRIDDARRMVAAVAVEQHEADWVDELKATAARLSAPLDDAPEFRRLVETEIREARTLLKLGELTGPLIPD